MRCEGLSQVQLEVVFISSIVSPEIVSGALKRHAQFEQRQE